MLTYSFENIGKTSLYEHLYNCIKKDILSGTLPVNYKLPSKRSFSKNLGISTITVENAYAQLVAEGYIYSLPKKGYYVSDISGSRLPDTPHADCIRTNSAFFSDVSCETFFADLASNYINKENFPFYTWSKLMREVINDSGDKLLTASPSAGVYPLRAAISRHLKAFRGMEVDSEQIIVGAGTEYLYSLLIQLLGRDQIFAVEDPGYQKIRLIYENNNVNCLSIPLVQDGIDLDKLCQSTANILHLSLSHHYPTGIVTPIGKRHELLKWAAASPDRFIIEDDYDSEFRLFGKPIPSLQSIDTADKVIYMNTFTKTLTPTIRISYMVLPKPLLALFNERLSFYSCTVSNFEQYTLARFIDCGYFEKHINRMRIFYRKQRNLMIEAISQSPIFPLVQIQEADSGLHFLLKVQTALTDEALTKKARENGLKIACLSMYYHDISRAAPHILVINYSGIKQEKIHETIRLLYHCICSKP